MAPNRKECEALALQLSPKDRAALAEVLIASLDTLGEDENARLWMEEAERRYQEYEQGILSARPAEEVLRDARSALQ